MSWLPTFSVEVTHINSVFRVGPILPTATHTSQVRNMARQVQQMFPTYPISVIIADLQVSRSMEVTIDNILEGRLPIPAAFQFDDDAEFGETAAATTTTTTNSGEARMSTIAEAVALAASSTSAMFAGDRFEASTSTSNSSLDSGYEIERNSNIFGNQNELLRDER